MNRSTKQLLYYIREARSSGFGQFSDASDVGPPSPKVSAMQDEAKKREKQRKDAAGIPEEPKAKPIPAQGKILIDPSVMGKEGGERVAEPIAHLSSAINRAYLAGGAALGAIGRPLSDVLTGPERAQKELRAQQSAVQSMTNVSNYYKNLGIPTPSMHPKQDLLTTLKGILTNL